LIIKILIGSSPDSHFKGPWTPKLTIQFIHFPESAKFSDNFDSNIGAQRFGPAFCQNGKIYL